jgi:hypothetical protein
MAPLRQRLDEFKRTSESGAPSLQREVVDTMHRIGHVFIIIGVAPIRFGGWWRRGHLGPFTDRAYAEMADDAGRPEIPVSVSRRGRGTSVVIGVEALPQGWRECCSISIQLRQEAASCHNTRLES